ncbi:helix-turn-helix domain-containing protein [Candidatus Electronema sp. PJ]|uniref:helix-turn-helix domain-containing protein n=1 Tax=Candidatus Electronema sp. PJ TaxID=3401572 RepID=UPI003AA81C96
MTERDIGAEILAGLKEIREFKKGKAQLRTVKLSVPQSARQIRERLNLSQSAFASMMGVSVRTVQDWEQGRRTPKGPARSLLRIAEQNPKAFLAVSFAA